MKKIILLNLLLGVLIFMNSCKINNPIEPLENPTDHSGTLTEDATWASGETHIIDGTVYLKGNTITIEPGAVIKFNANSQIIVGDDPNASTTLLAVGTAEKPIIFTSANATPVAGDWYGVVFDEGTSPNTNLQFCTFEYGGGYSDDSQIITVKGNTKLYMDNCLVRHSSSNGIDLYDDDSRFTSFTNNTISDVVKHAIQLNPNNVYCIGAGNIFTTSGTNGLEIRGGTMDKASATWKAHTVPYVISGHVYVQSETGSQLTIEAGATLSFTNNTSLKVSYYDNTFGKIIAEGTADAPITFTSANATPSAGDWYNVVLYDGSAANSFKYCNFEYGGGYSDNSSIVHANEGADITIENCTIKHSSSNGIVLSDDETRFTSFKNNTMSDIAKHFICLNANAVDGIGTGNDFQTTVSNKGILIYGSTMDKASATWKKQNVPYILNGHVYIESTNGSVLTIDAGSTILFQKNVSLRVSYYDNTFGKIIAQGTSTDKITFSTAAPVGSQSNGDWYDIVLYDGTSTGTIFDNCIFEYGGGYSSSGALLYLGNGCSGSKVSITNSLFQHSESHGISYDDDSGVPTMSGNTFIDIAGDNVHIR